MKLLLIQLHPTTTVLMKLKQPKWSKKNKVLDRQQNRKLNEIKQPLLKKDSDKSLIVNEK